MPPSQRSTVQSLPPQFEPPRSGIFAKISGALFGILTLFAIITLWLGVYSIDQGEVGVIKRNGAAIGVADPGLHVKIPYIDTVTEIEVREKAAHLDLKVSSRDPMLLPISATVNWLVNKNKILDMYAEYGSLEQIEQRVIIPAFNDGIKTATANFTVNDLLRDRTKLGELALTAVRARVPRDVVTITQLYIVDVSFPEAYTQQILAKQVAAEAALTEQHKLEQQKLQAQQKVQTAEAERDATKAAADGEAYKIKTQGDAIAQAIETRGKALATNPLVIDYEKVQRWGGDFPATFMGGDGATNTLWSLPGKASAPSK
ncbi:MAG: prohibitin family protein [Betaproteobacteria bacterium]